MITTLGTWEIKTNLSKHLGSAAIRICLVAAARPEVSPGALELEQEAGDFIARHVLEKDSVIFEG
jgi:hypothetical protein